MAGNNALLFKTLLLFVFLTVAWQCDKDNCKGYYNYTFATEGLAIYPASDSIKLGDSMWVVYDEPLKPLDLLTGDSVDLSGGTNFVNFLVISKLSDQPVRALKSFKFGKKIGSLEVDSRFPTGNLLFRPEVVGNRLMSTFYLVPLERGDYQIGSDDVSPVKLNAAPSGFCGGAAFKVPFANEDSHRWLYKLYVDSNYTFIKFDDEHVYTFRVY